MGNTILSLSFKGLNVFLSSDYVEALITPDVRATPFTDLALMLACVEGMSMLHHQE